MQRSPLVHRRGSGACPDTGRSNRPCAITTSTHSVFPDSTSPPKLNPVEPPWYGPVCPVVWEGWHREVSPYPNLLLGALLARCGEASLPMPGGDAIGLRGIDFHVAGLRAMGAEVEVSGGALLINGRRSKHAYGDHF